MSENGCEKIQGLLLFNLATDADDPILGFTTRWIQELATHCERLDVITMRAGRLDVPGNVRVFSVGKERGYSEARRLWEFYRILVGLCWRQRYDACFAHMMPLFVVLAAPLLRLQRIPAVLWYTHKSVTRLLRLATRCVQRVVTASPESFRLPSAKVRVIGHGIDTTHFCPLVRPPAAERPFTLLSVSRIASIKRLDLMIQAVALLKQQRPELALRLKIVGGPLTDVDRAYFAELKRLAAAWQVAEIVEFVGDMPFHQIAPYYQQADCFLSLSDTGSIDKAVLEAMSCGLLVLVNPIFQDVLGAELARQCVVQWDAADVAAHLAQMAALSAAERREIGQRLRAIVVARHDLRRLAEQLIEEFASLRLCPR